MNKIRLVQESDIPELKHILDSINLFPSEMLDEMISGYLNNPENEDIWFTEIENDRPISIGYCAPETLAEGTYNLYALGVKSDTQSKGTGTRMIAFIEDHLKLHNHRILIVETSSIDDFKSSREFYENLGYHKEAVIRDFWSKGDDKVIYWKKLK